MKTRLRLDAEIDLLNKGELEDALGRHDAWQREAAFGLKHVDIPRMMGTPSSGTLLLGADQPDQPPCGPGSGNVWGVKRVSVNGLASGDQVKLWKGSRFVCWIDYQPGYVAFGRGQLVLGSQDWLRVTGTGLSTTAQVEVTGEADNVPAVMLWKIID